MPDAPSPIIRKTEVTVSWITILKLLVAALLTYLAIRLWPLIELLLIALLITITLLPIDRWLRRRVPAWASIFLIGLMLAVFVALFAGILVPTVWNEGAQMIGKLPSLQKTAVESSPGVVRDAVNKVFESASFSNPEPLLKNFLTWGAVAVQALGEFLVVLVLAVYLVADGDRVYRWLLAFLPVAQRKKTRAASKEIGGLMSSYMMGQFVTSLMCGVYVFALLSILKVPSAALLAVIAAVFDILPLIGFFLSIIPALIIALSASPLTAGLVFVFYGAYHLAEVYFIVPKVYGNRLRLSTLTVLVSCMAAGIVAGVVGAIIILPFVASYPIVERTWLKPHLQPGTVTKHEEIDDEEEAES